MCSCSDGDGPKVFERVLRKARPLKSVAGYQCCECAREIKRGDWHEEVSGLWGESWDQFRTCLRCVARREAWRVVECAPVFGSLRETIVECLVTNDYDRGIGRMRRHIDRKVGLEYIVALRAARAKFNTELEAEERLRSEHYAIAGQKREAKKKILAWLGDGI